MKNQIVNANRATRRANKGLIATKQLICNYIDLVEVSLNAESEEPKDGEQTMQYNYEKRKGTPSFY